jgi:signal transduction histidine kinase/HAMP domain-containing protein
VKLALRIPFVVALLMLGLGGFVFWVMNGRIMDDTVAIVALKARLAERDKAGTELAAKLKQAKVERTAAEAASRVVYVLDSFVRDTEAELRSPSLLNKLGDGRAGWAAAAAGVMARSLQPLDRVVVSDARGLVAAVVPPNDSLLGQRCLKSEELKLMSKRGVPLFKQEILAGGQARSMVVSVSFKGEQGSSIMGVLMIQTALENLLKDAVRGATDEGDLKILVVDRQDDIIYAPSRDLVGKQCRDTEFKPALDVKEEEGTEMIYSGKPWVAVRKAAPLEMKVIMIAPLGIASAEGEAGSEAKRPAPPYFVIGVAAIVAIGFAIALVILPLGRLEGLAQAAQSLVAGAAAVEFKKAGVKDEIGEVTRAVQRLGEMLAEERRHREESGAAYAQAQSELARAQSSTRELAEYQKDLESRARREKEALETELVGVRTELDGARTEAGEAQTQALAKDAAIAERDNSIVALNAQIQQMISDLDGIRQSMGQQAVELSEARHELERRANAPIASFTLLSEATDALTIELSGLLDHVQGYISGIIETSGGAISDEQQEFLTTVINRSARSQRYLGDIRDFSNISKPGGLAMEPVDLIALLDDVAATIQQATEDKGLEFATDIPSSIPEARGDETRLRQLFMVILQTAVRFTPDGGKVSMMASLKGDIAGIRIEDGADPIPLSSDEVFGHFHSTEEEALELRGSGLRYPILRAIASAHSGSIDLAINERGGNLFFIRLPVRAGVPTAEMTAELFGAAAAITLSAAAESPETTPMPVFLEPSIDTSAPGLEAIMAAPGESPAAIPVLNPLDLSGLSDLFAAVPPDAPSVETTESIMAAPSAETTPEPWPVPEVSGPADATFVPPEIDAIEPAPGASEARGRSEADRSPASPAPGESQVLDASVPRDQAPGEEKKPEPPVSFGNDEIIQE